MAKSNGKASHGINKSLATAVPKQPAGAGVENEGRSKRVKTRGELKEELQSDPTKDYHYTRYNFFGELFVQNLPLWRLHTGRMMLTSDPIVSFSMNIRNAALMAAEVDIEAKNPEVAEWVRKQWDYLWDYHRIAMVSSKELGFAPLQTLWREDEKRRLNLVGLKEFAPEDCRGKEKGGKVVGFAVKGEPLFFPHGLWLSHDAKYGGPYGNPITRRQYPAWYEKWMERGAKRLQQLRMIKDAYIGDIFWYPPDLNLEIPDGQGGTRVLPWRDVLREIAECRMSGGAMTLPLKLNDKGHELTRYQPPTAIPGATEIFNWVEYCDNNILKGGDVPIETIEAPTSGSGFSGRSIPFLVLLSVCNGELTQVVQQTDERSLRSVASLTFGGDPEYTIKPRSLVETFSADIQGSSLAGGSIGGPVGQQGGQGVPQAVQQQYSEQIKLEDTQHEEEAQFEEGQPKNSIPKMRNLLEQHGWQKVHPKIDHYIHPAPPPVKLENGMYYHAPTHPGRIELKRKSEGGGWVHLDSNDWLGGSNASHLQHHESLKLHLEKLHSSLQNKIAEDWKKAPAKPVSQHSEAPPDEDEEDDWEEVDDDPEEEEQYAEHGTTPLHISLAKRFKIPVRAVKDVLHTPVEELKKRDSYFARSGHTAYPISDYPKHKLGTAKIDEYVTPHHEAYVSFLTKHRTAKVKTTEPEEGIKGHHSYQTYLGWAKAGHKPPPINTNESWEGKKILSSNRRRTLAAKEAGVRHLVAWHSPINHETGLPLKYKDIHEAAKEHASQHSEIKRDEHSLPLPYADWFNEEQFGEGGYLQRLRDLIGRGLEAAKGRVKGLGSYIRGLNALESFQSLAGTIEEQIRRLSPLLGNDLFADAFPSHAGGTLDVLSRLPGPEGHKEPEAVIEPPIAPQRILETANLAVPQPVAPPPVPPALAGILFPEPHDPEVHLPAIEAAVEALEKSPVAVGTNYLETAQKVKEGSFAITGELTEKAVTDVREVLAKVIEEGKPQKEFIETVAKRLEEEGSPLSPPHLENVFRTNTMSAYSKAQDQAVQHPLVSDAFPYALYSATRDARVRPQHWALEKYGLNGSAMYRYDDPTFKKFRPPWSYNCRCRWTPQTVEQAAKRGVEEAKAWLDRAKMIAKVQGGTFHQYLAQTAPVQGEHVTPPSFEPDPAFNRDLVTQMAEAPPAELLDPEPKAEPEPDRVLTLLDKVNTAIDSFGDKVQGGFQSIATAIASRPNDPPVVNNNNIIQVPEQPPPTVSITNQVPEQPPATINVHNTVEPTPVKIESPVQVDVHNITPLHDVVTERDEKGDIIKLRQVPK